MPAFPIDLRVDGWPVVVIGGGAVAARRVEALLHCGAVVAVVSPRLSSALKKLSDRFAWTERRFSPGDCTGMKLVLGCVDDRSVSQSIFDAAKRHGALVSIADAPSVCDFYFGAVARRGDVTLAVYTDGKAPAMAAMLRDVLVPQLSDRVIERTARFVELRRRLRKVDALPQNARCRANFLMRFADDAALDALSDAGAMAQALNGYRHSAVTASGGKVYVVGAGPGDPDLLTVRAARLIASADDLVVDALVPPAVYASAKARVVYVGKRAGRPRVQQSEIHRILIDLAARGGRVVRLKGGDPGVFGRLEEETGALRAAGVRFEIVPGVSSATASATAAGVSLTARGVADRVLILTGHSHADAADALPALPVYHPDQTLIVMMGLSNVDRLAEGLLQRGYPADLPAVVVSRASLPDQRSITAPLGLLADHVAGADVQLPATILIGHAVEQAVASESLLGSGGRHGPVKYRCRGGNM